MVCHAGADLQLCSGVDIVTFGQYLQPTPQHLPVKEFVTPEQFEAWRVVGEQEMGFRSVSAAEHLLGHAAEQA